MNQTWKTGEKANFGTDFGPFGTQKFFRGSYFY